MINKLNNLKENIDVELTSISLKKRSQEVVKNNSKPLSLFGKMLTKVSSWQVEENNKSHLRIFRNLSMKTSSQNESHFIFSNYLL